MSIVAVVVFAASCGGDDGDEESSPTTGATVPATTSAAPADPRTPEQLAADRAQAERIVLKLSDFPPGWTSEPDPDEDSPELVAARLRFADCLGLDRSLITSGGRSGANAQSDNFEDEDNLQVQNRVTVLLSAERARDQIAVLRKPEAEGCFQTFVNAAIQLALTNPGPGRPPPTGVSFGQAQVDAVTVPGLRADSVAYRATLPLTVETQTRDAVFDIVLAVKGRTVIAMFFFNIGAPFPGELETSLTNTVIDRAPDN